MDGWEGWNGSMWWWANIHLLFAKGKFYFQQFFTLLWTLPRKSSSAGKKNRREEEELEDLFILSQQCCFWLAEWKKILEHLKGWGEGKMSCLVPALWCCWVLRCHENDDDDGEKVVEGARHRTSWLGEMKANVSSFSRVHAKNEKETQNSTEPKMRKWQQKQKRPDPLRPAA